MMRIFLVLCFFLATIQECLADSVILLHGIARSPASLEKLETALKEQGYQTLNLNYPAREKSLEQLVEAIHSEIARFATETDGKVHFVTHSMGGLVARGYIQKYRPQNLGNVVMLAPPNQGSDVADLLKDNLAYKHYFGPAGQQLITSPTTDLQELLGEVDYPLGVIAGDRSVNLLSSWLIIPGPDDGKLTISQTWVKGVSDTLVLHVTHPFMMNDPEVITQTINFLKRAEFNR